MVTGGSTVQLIFAIELSLETSGFLVNEPAHLFRTFSAGPEFQVPSHSDPELKMLEWEQVRMVVV